MNARITTPATLVAALGCGLIAGVFFAFSTFVLPALAKLPAAQGTAAMQSINVVVLNKAFLGVFMGTMLLSLALAVISPFDWSSPAAKFRIAGAVFYVIGSFGVTMAFNVPLNDALAAIVPDTGEGPITWARYVHDWSIWNHVRGGASLLGSASFILSLFWRSA